MYVVLHCRKIKTTGGLAAVAKHNARQGIYNASERPIIPQSEMPPWLTKPENRTLNVLNQHEALPLDRLFRRRKQRLEQLSRKPRKDAATGVEAVYSASPEFFADKTPEQVSAFFEDCLRWNNHRFGAQNVLHYAIHYDETTPHMHVVMLPITRRKRGEKVVQPGAKERYSSADFLGGRNGMREMQTEIAEEVGEKWGLERGIEGSKARHKNQVDITKMAEHTEKEVAQKLDDLKQRTIKVRQLEHEIKLKSASLKTAQNVLERDRIEFESYIEQAYKTASEQLEEKAVQQAETEKIQIPYESAKMILAIGRQWAQMIRDRGKEPQAIAIAAIADVLHEIEDRKKSIPPTQIKRRDRDRARDRDQGFGW